MKRSPSRTTLLAALLVAAAVLCALVFLRPQTGIRFDPERLEASQWVRFYRPLQASNGYNLVLYERRVPMLIDMNGTIVHSWPKVRARGRARLTPAGTLLLICADKVVRELDWDGELLWQFRNTVADDFPHHDLRRLRNGNILIPYRDLAKGTDYLLEVDSRGKVVWDWRSSEHLAELLGQENLHDRTHINSVQELPENRWFAAGDTRFDPRNLLLSSRQLNTVFVIDKTTGEVVWSYDQGLDYQHEATMTGPGLPGTGNIMIFNNGFHNRFSDRRSSVLEIDPSTGEIVWQYSSDTFFSRTGGVEQSLPNGNVLITSSRGGRVFEVDRAGAIVWQWTPPFLPMRARRYAYDYSPRFADLGRPPEKPVGPPVIRPYVDRDLYRFGLEGDVFIRTVDGQPRRFLIGAQRCRRLTLPASPTLEIGYGLDKKWISAAGLTSYRATFIVSIRSEESEASQQLARQTLNLDATWHEQTITLQSYAWARVELCLETDGKPLAVDGKRRIPVRWWDPLIVSSSPIPIVAEQENADRGKEAEQQLKALGYVD